MIRVSLRTEVTSAISAGRISASIPQRGTGQRAVAECTAERTERTATETVVQRIFDEVEVP